MTNFLGLQNFQTTVIVVTGDPNIPILSIIGQSYQIIVASSSLSLLSTASFSPCASQAKKIIFVWSVQMDGLTVSLPSISVDPTRYSLAPYKLVVGSTYLITVTATSGRSTSSVSVTVYVGHGAVTAAVLGGYIRSTPVDKPLLLDASISSDADISPSRPSTLMYQVTSIQILCLLLFIVY